MSDLLASPDKLVECFYASISFAPGQKPNYSLIYTLFHPHGRVMPPATDTGGSLKSMSVEEFIEYFDERIKDIIETGATEEQTSCKTNIFINVAQVFSAYQFTLTGSAEPLARGVNSIQLVFETGRWWISSLTWDRAQPGEGITI